MTEYRDIETGSDVTDGRHNRRITKKKRCVSMATILTSYALVRAFEHALKSIHPLEQESVFE